MKKSFFAFIAQKNAYKSPIFGKWATGLSMVLVATFFPVYDLITGNEMLITHALLSIVFIFVGLILLLSARKSFDKLIST
jgi:hypothetical protein